MRKIALLNQKGGVGKTTSAVNLGACLAELGRRVLLVDLDPQTNLSIHVGQEPLDGEPTVYSLIRGEHGFAETLRPTDMPGVDLIPSTLDLAGLEVELATAGSGREMRLKDVLARADGQYDYLLIDGPPSLGLLTLNAMCAVDEIFIPLQTEFFALQGVGRLVHTVELVRERLNPALRITGIIACLFDLRTTLAMEVLEDIREHFGARVFATVVRKNVRLAEAPSFGQPITAYDPECHGTEDYRSLAAEVVAMTGMARRVPAGDTSVPPLPQNDAPPAPEAPAAPQAPAVLAPALRALAEQIQIARQTTADERPAELREAPDGPVQ